MSWNNCRKCIFLPRTNFTSTIFKVLLTLKLLHGSRLGAKGSTLEDIAMHMIKHFSLDGDIKSQVLASLKYGVKMHFIQKRKEKFGLILPASSVQLAPCKYKNGEIERINCIFPPVWHSNACQDTCGGSDESCCGKRKRSHQAPCCHEPEEESAEDVCEKCIPKRSKSVCKPCSRASSRAPKSICSECCSAPKKSRRSAAPCPKAKPPICSRRRRRGPPKPLYDDYCQLCAFDDDEEDCKPSFNYDAYKNCSCCQKK